MSVIVAGTIHIKSEDRQKFIALSLPAIVAARANPSCRDFSVSPDPIDDSRVNIFEHWDSKPDLDDFRGSGPGDDLSSMIERADVQEYVIG